MSLSKTGIFAVMLALLVCAGGAVLMNGSDDVDAVGETYEIQYVVADTTYSFSTHIRFGPAKHQYIRLETNVNGVTVS